MPAARNATYYPGDLRRDLIDAAVQAAAEHGPAHVSLRDLARRLGVSHAAPKNHFADKRALFTAVASEAHERLGAEMARALQAAAEHGAGDDPVALLRVGGGAYLRFARENAAWFAVMWQEDLQDRDDPALLEASARTLGPLVELAGRAGGGALAGADPMRVALLLWSVVHGLADLSTSGTLDDLPGAGDPVSRDEGVLDLFLAILRRAVT